MRTIFVIFFALLIPFSFFVLYQNFFTTEVIKDTSPTQLPNNELSLPTQNGRDVVIPDITRLPEVKEDVYNDGLYYVGVQTRPTDLYTITYDETSGYFNIVLLKTPFALARTEAENKLRQVLELDDSSLCDLTYTVTVPGYVNQAASGVDYRFSFCDDAVTLES